ncbi:hypothetical protein Q7C36_009689 [Tachysurus vachellii]|uniref:Uncharacterized protein n=1 Tax=Tachysurus vachellii TaxID=175792 RepID=A0AA88N0T8_TACVA|nr:hypothetical protein Q7C36_009689 [Tachysurus vachellii]
MRSLPAAPQCTQTLMKGKCSYLYEKERLSLPPAAAPPYKILSSAGHSFLSLALTSGAVEVSAGSIGA